MVDYLQDAIEAVKDSNRWLGVNVVPVWFCKTAQNWKAILISDCPEDDKAIYEVTHIGDENKTVVDRYTKTDKTIL